MHKGLYAPVGIENAPNKHHLIDNLRVFFVQRLHHYAAKGKRYKVSLFYLFLG